MAVEAALQAGRRRVECVLVGDAADEEKLGPLLAAAARRGVAVKRAAAAELDTVAHGRSHGSVVAIAAPLPAVGERELLSIVDSLRTPPLLLLLDGAEDDRNLGFTLRSAEALGATALLLKKHVVDWDETEVARTSSGALERLPLVRIDRETELLRELRRRRFELVACVANAKRSIWGVDLRGPTLLCVGGEKRGLSGAVRDECTLFARIPMQSEAGSLSMSHAAALLLGEASRQRRGATSAIPAPSGPPLLGDPPLAGDGGTTRSNGNEGMR